MPAMEDLLPWVEAETGMDFSGNRSGRLRDAIQKVMSRIATTAGLDRLPAMERGPFLERLTAELTVGETFFFRNEFHFRALREHVIPDILRENADKREIRIWSAGCATGEEPYSLAILLDQILTTISNRNLGWATSILGTDLNPEFLQKAREGCYRMWSFRQSDIQADRRYFLQESDSFRLLPHVRDRVRFAYLNLVKDVYPSPLTGTMGMDLIVFRNVAIYLKPEVTAAIIERFHRALRPGGWLLLGEAEVSFAPTLGFEVQRFDQATIFRKTSDRAAEPSKYISASSLPVLALVSLAAQSILPSVPPIPKWVPRPKPLARPLLVQPSLARKAGEIPLAPGSDAGRQKAAVAELGDATAWQRIEPLLRQRHLTEADRIIDRISDLQERACTRLRYVQALLACAEISRAHRMLDLCLKEQPLLLEAQLLKASFAEEAGDLKAAEQSYRRALYIDRSCPMAHFHLALVQQQQGNRAGAARSLRTTLKLIEHKDPHALVEYGEGVCYGRLKEMAAVISGCRLEETIDD
jgi:chemotaxis protein methyltransferase CheR